MLSERLAVRMRKARPQALRHAYSACAELGQATLEWTTIAALVAALMVPACFGIWFASQGLYSSLDNGEDVSYTQPHAVDTIKINFFWATLKDGTVDTSTISSFGSEWGQDSAPGEPLSCPPTDVPKDGKTFQYWVIAGDWNTPVTVPATVPSKTVTYIAVYG